MGHRSLCAFRNMIEAEEVGYEGNLHSTVDDSSMSYWADSGTKQLSEETEGWRTGR